jgi:hypothetical protein
VSERQLTIDSYYTREVNVLQDMRVSIGRTWRFVTPAGAVTVAQDLAGYRHHLDDLKSRPFERGFGLPWPPYRSTLWGYIFGEAYRNTRTKLLVAALLPLLLENMIESRMLNSGTSMPFASLDSAEALLHPFAVTTILHLSLPGSEPWSAEGQAASLFDDLMRHPLTADQPGQVRDGMPLSLLPGLASQDADGHSAGFEPTGGFAVLSGLHDERDPAALAYQLASLYQKQATDKSRPMNTVRSAISVTDRRVGMLLPENGFRAQPRVACLHHNITTLLAYMENLAAVVSDQVTEPCRWFQSRAALVLNHLYRRKPLPATNGIYKSRVAEMWVDHRDLARTINQVNAQDQPSPSALPEG